MRRPFSQFQLTSGTPDTSEPLLEFQGKPARQRSVACSYFLCLCYKVQCLFSGTFTGVCCSMLCNAPQLGACHERQALRSYSFILSQQPLCLFYVFTIIFQKKWKDIVSFICSFLYRFPVFYIFAPLFRLLLVHLYIPVT